MMQDLVVGVVLYYPNFESLKVTLNFFKTQVKHIILFDNGMDAELREQIISLNVHLIGNGKNIGIAAALNAIMDFADKSLKSKWVLVSDQDSSFTENIVSEYTKLFSDDSIGIICPNIVKSNNQNLKKNNVGQMDIGRCPTSGMAMRVSDWKRAGKYNEDLFIDYVDYDICEKFILMNKRITRLNNVYLIQQLGNVSEIKGLMLLGKLLKSQRLEKAAMTFNHSPVRNYYFVRNGIIYVRTYKDNIDVKKEIFFIVKWELKKLLFEKKKISQLRSTVLGVHDGVKYSI